MTDQEYNTTDKDIILVLLTAGLPIVRTWKDGSNKTIFYFSEDLALPWIDKFQKNIPMPFDIAAFLRALRLFNSIVHSR